MALVVLAVFKPLVVLGHLLMCVLEIIYMFISGFLVMAHGDLVCGEQGGEVRVGVCSCNGGAGRLFYL